VNDDRPPASRPAGPNAPQEGFGRLEREIALLLRRARVISQRLSGELHPDLDGSAYGLLALLQDLGPLRAGDLVARLGQDKSTVSRQVTKLVELGLVDRTADPVDGRAQVLAPSPEGSARLERIRAARRARWEADLADWPADDVAMLGELLARLNRLGEARDDVRPGDRPQSP
jgi:DNA-binding MarR family transcriptional regulator